MFCFICKVLSVFISSKADEQISSRMVKSELAAKAEQEICLISKFRI